MWPNGWTDESLSRLRVSSVLEFDDKVFAPSIMISGPAVLEAQALL